MAAENAALQEETAMDEQAARTTLVRLAIRTLATQDVESLCRALIGGASAGEIVVRASYCKEAEAFYTAGFSDNAGADEWKAIVGKLEAKITWSKPALLGLWKATPGSQTRSNHPLRMAGIPYHQVGKHRTSASAARSR